MSLIWQNNKLDFFFSEVQLKHSNVEKELVEVENLITKMKTDLNKIKKQHAEEMKQIQQTNTKKKKKIKAKKREKTLIQQENREQESESIKLMDELELAENKVEEAKSELETIIFVGQRTLNYIKTGFKSE